MSFAYLALYTGDYFRDTRGLSMAGHGCYFLLLTYCWDSRGPLPLDEERIAGICNARSNEERTTMSKVLNTYFTCMEDGWYNRRMQREIEKAHAIGLARKAAGAKGYLARAKQVPNKSLASARLLPLSSPPPPSSTPGSNDVDSQRHHIRRATRLPDDWRIPDEWIDWTEKAYHLDRPAVIKLSLEFRDYWIAIPGARGVKVNWFATWRNRCRQKLENARV